MGNSEYRWLQFSLRTGFILVTLLCIALSLFVPAERRRRAVAAIEVLGGKVAYVDGRGTAETSLESFLRRWLPQAYLDGWKWFTSTPPTVTVHGPA